MLHIPLLRVLTLGHDGKVQGMPVSSEPDLGDELGPIDFLAVEFPAGGLSAPGFEQLLSVADRGVIAILDLDVAELPAPEGVDLIAKIDPGSVAAVIIYEDRCAVDLVNTWRRDGARFIADGGLAISDALDQAEA